MKPGSVSDSLTTPGRPVGAACVVTLVDRLIHRAEIITIDGDSYRLKEAKERAALKATVAPKAKRAPR